MNNQVLRTFKAHGSAIDIALPGNGRAFRGRFDRHPYELFIQLEEIEHRTTRAKRPKSNCFVKRLHRTLLDGHFHDMGRETLNDGIDEMHRDLHASLSTITRSDPSRGATGTASPPMGLRARPPKQSRKDQMTKPDAHTLAR